jgi:hypothetical protein
MTTTMILKFRLHGQDDVTIELVEPTGARVVGEYHFAKEHAHLLVQTLEEAFANEGKTLQDVSGIIVQWSENARFTVSRVVGVTANTIAHSLHVPVIAIADDVSDEDALELLRDTSNTQIDIQYSSDPTITL